MRQSNQPETEKFSIQSIRGQFFSVYCLSTDRNGITVAETELKKRKASERSLLIETK